MISRVRWYHILLLLAVAKLILHFTTNTLWSLHRDALLYLALGRHLDWGYASVPPSIAFFGWLSDHLLGGSVFAIRLIPTLVSTLTVILTGMMAREMTDQENGARGNIAALLVGIAGLTCGAYLRPGMLFQPVVFDIFYWTLSSWLLLKYVNTEHKKWLIWLGVALGLGLLNKYSVVFLIVGLIPWLLLSRHGNLLAGKTFYQMAGVALLIFSPNLIWQIRHQFPVVRHMQELAATQFVHVTLEGFLVDQLFFFLPAVPLWILGLFYLLFHQEGMKWRGFGCMYLVVIFLMIVLNGKSYYTIGAYPVLIAAGAAYLENRTRQKIWIPVLLAAMMLVVALPRFPFILPVLNPEKAATYFEKRLDSPITESALRWEDGRIHPLPQDFADMLGWEEIAEMTGKAWQMVENKHTAAIYAENYGLAGAIEHFGKPYDLPEVLSFSDNYRYWLPDSLSRDFKTLIYVNDELGDDMPGFFEKIEQVGQLDMPLSRQHGTLIFICRNPTDAFFDRIGKAISNAKNEVPID
jgi:hypothetical protein